MKKSLSILLCLVMLLSVITIIPFSASAESVDVVGTGTSRTSAEAVAWVGSQNGKALDYDGAYGAQCVDLIMYYYQYLGVSSPGGNAKDYTWNALPSGWTRTSSPSAGDIVVWGAGSSLGKSGYYADGTYGHIGIVTAVSGGYMDYYDQNAYPQGQVVGGHSGHLVSSAATFIHPNFAGSTPIGNNPYGYLDIVECPSPGIIHVKGWAFDRDDVNASLVIDIYVGGAAGSGAKYYRIVADKERTDVNSQFNCGNYHGFDETFCVFEIGLQAVYAYALNIGGGTDNPLLFESPKSVYITPDTEEPFLSNVYVDNYSEEGYTIHFTLTDNAALGSVTIYTNVNNVNRKEDVIKLSGSEQNISYEVKYSDYGTNTGYKHGIWAWDISGNKYQSPWILLEDYLEAIILGDADGDGKVTAVDVTRIMLDIVRLNPGVDHDTLMNGDVDQNGILAITDVTYIQRYLAKLETPFAIGEAIG